MRPGTYGSRRSSHDEPLESYKDYSKRTIERYLNEQDELIAKILGSSLKNEDKKRVLRKISSKTRISNKNYKV